jgi:hypothetical protein
MSCDLRVLMDQPAQPISSHDPPSRRQDNWLAGPKWRCLPQGPVRAVAVVVAGILSQHRPQLPAAQDQHPVQQLPPNGPHPPFGIRVRLRRPHRRDQHLDSVGGEDRVERGGELRIPVAVWVPRIPSVALTCGFASMAEVRKDRLWGA